jgi:hypothetical protein
MRALGDGRAWVACLGRRIVRQLLDCLRDSGNARLRSLLFRLCTAIRSSARRSARAR